MQNFSTAIFHKLIILISRNVFSKLVIKIKLVMNGLLFKKIRRMEDGHQSLFLAFRHFSWLTV